MERQYRLKIRLPPVEFQEIKVEPPLPPLKIKRVSKQ